ncbi:A/G-specific adenine glycosylase (EC [Olavius algarvensis associated proteobacterium Delta 3]|nr:A/G-specific adenine glycosylase (EC [Olavius algarvensis associated proteobacterium Delta 3]CAB5161534.1 A/G-specific adenine glycosylase (EC [Olavius algarvensis associated proteobacterium Delta 3]
MKTPAISAIQRKLTDWYVENRRDLPWRKTRDPYRIWVSEVMLQQTQVQTVIPYFNNFVTAYPDVASLARADLQSVLKSWEGMGYYARARNLHRAARRLHAETHGRVPSNWADFRALPGVGDYIAAAVLSIAFDKPYAVVDGNVKRVLARLSVVDAPVNQSGSMTVFRKMAESLLDRAHPGTFNQAVMELGALVCTPRSPSCKTCPLTAYCRAFLSGRVDAYPKKEKRKPVPQYHIAAGVVEKNRRLLITRRSPDVMLGGLWEFPGGKVRRGETAEAACVREIREEVNLAVAVESHLTRVRHAYSHFKIILDVFRCRYLSGRVRRRGPVAHRWVSYRQLDRYPFPGANRKFLHLLKE